MSFYGNLINESFNFNLNSIKMSLKKEIEDDIENDKICNILIKELKNNFNKSYDKIYNKFKLIKNDLFLSDIKINNSNDLLKYITPYQLEFGEAYNIWKDGTKYYAIFQFFIFYKEYEKLSEENKENNKFISITLEAGIDENYKSSLKDEDKILNFFIDG